MRGTVLERLLAHSAPNAATGCREWTGALVRTGYGCIRINKRSVLAHRASYEQHKGIIPPGLFVCHSCDNRRCINPDHLWVGTQFDNVADALAKGRLADVSGERNPRAKLTARQVYQIRRAAARGEVKAHLARRYGVTKTLITKIVKNHIWQERSNG